MDYPNTNTERRKGKHLNYDELHLIEIRLRDDWTANRIAVQELHCSPNTVRNAIKKGMALLYNGKVSRFKAKTAWEAYQQNRQNCCRHYDALKKASLSTVCGAVLSRRRLVIGCLCRSNLG